MRFRWVFLILLFLISFLPGCAKIDEYVGPKKQVVSYDTQVIKVETPISFELLLDSGNADIYSWKKNEIKFEITKKVRGTKTENELKKELENFYISIKEYESKIVMKAGYNGSIKAPNDRGVDLKIYLPKELNSVFIKVDIGKVRFLDDIRCMLNTNVSMANIEINKLDGKIEALSDMGNIVINEGELKSGSKIKVNMGNIIIRSEIDSTGEYLFETYMGNIDISLKGNPDINLEAIGNLSINEFSDSISGAQIKARSDMGKISVTKIN